jgi:hypothetical protein
VWYFCGSLVFILSLLRVFVIRLQETPKYLLGKGRDEEVVALLQSIATKHNRPCSLTLAKLQSCGDIANAHSSKKFSFSEIRVHLKGLFASKKLGINIILIWFSWTLIGLAYPLYNVFLVRFLSAAPLHRHTWLIVHHSRHISRLGERISAKLHSQSIGEITLFQTSLPSSVQ